MEFQIKSEKNRIRMEDENGRQIGELDFPEMKPGIVNILHTGVRSEFGGHGLAGKMTQALAEQLRAENRKAVLTCSYAIKWFSEHPEYADVLEDPEKEAKKAGMTAGPACGIKRPE